MHSSNLANSQFARSVQSRSNTTLPRNLAPLAPLPNLSNTPALPPRRASLSHAKQAAGFDKWLDGLLDQKTKNKMVHQFGYKFSTSPTHKKEIKRPARKIQSAPDTFKQRSNGLFQALSANAR